jgi:methionine aminopeptidase
VLDSSGRSEICALAEIASLASMDNLSAQYEHTMIITKSAPIIVTQH